MRNMRHPATPRLAASHPEFSSSQVDFTVDCGLAADRTRFRASAAKESSSSLSAVVQISDLPMEDGVPRGATTRAPEMLAGDLVDFTPDEWLAILPAAVAAPRRTPGSGPLTSPADPAAMARSERPLTTGALRREIGALSGHLAAWIDLQVLLAPLNTRPGLRPVLQSAAGLALSPALAVLNDGRFSARAVACGTAGFCAIWLFASVGLFRAAYSSSYFRLSKDARKGPDRAAPASAAAPDPDLGSHALATIARWKELLDLQGPGGPANGDVCADAIELGHGASALVAHREGDPMCPCGLRSCSGTVAVRAAWSRDFEFFFRWATSMVAATLIPYTAVVTYAGSFWSAWWWALLGALFYAICAWVYLGGAPGRFIASFPAMGLAERLHVRAMSLALDSVLDRLDGQLRSTERASAEERKPAMAEEPASEELYVRLHLLLSRIWEKRIPYLFTGDRTTFFLLCASAAIAAALNLIGGLCIPVWLVLYVSWLLAIFFIDFIGIAASNSQIRSVVALYVTARQALRRMALLHRTHPLASEIDRHDRMLSSLLDVRGLEMRFWGVPVGYGTVRTVAATMLTVGFALWGLARGSGIYLTMESVCY